MRPDECRTDFVDIVQHIVKNRVLIQINRYGHFRFAPFGPIDVEEQGVVLVL